MISPIPNRTLPTPALSATAPPHRVASWLVVAVIAVTALAPSASTAKGALVLGSGDSGLQWALIGPGDRVSSSTWTDESQRLLERLRQRDRELLWLRLEDHDYVVTDRAALEEARTAFRPVIEIGSQQGRLGRAQGELGRRQGRLGREQGRVGSLQGRLSARLARTDAAAEGRRDRAEVRRQIEELAAMQRELAEAQQPLALRQQELGRRQQALGERQREATAEALRTLGRLAAGWIADGTAQPFSD
jgi:bla regulator protein blaR1